MELTNEQKAKIFAMYWGCEYIQDECATQPIGRLNFPERFNRAKIKLRKIDQITDNEVWILNRLEDWFDYNEMWAKSSALKNGKWNLENYQSRDFLISVNIAVPLFIAPNHPGNGKNAVELGLAEYITETMRAAATP